MVFCENFRKKKYKTKNLCLKKMASISKYSSFSFLQNRYMRTLRKIYMKSMIKSQTEETQDGNYSMEADSLSSDSKTSLRCQSHTWWK
jgi:hypothetical protein